MEDMWSSTQRMEQDINRAVERARTQAEQAGDSHVHLAAPSAVLACVSD